MQKSIVHFDLDSFYVSVERLKNSKLIGLPLIIGGSSNRGVVASCSYEARKYGVRSAMPIKQAKMLCPHAVFLSGDMEDYIKYSRLVTDIICDKAPIVEKASIDEFYLDISGLDKYFGCYKWTTEVQQFITKESGLPSTFCLSINKLISKMGAAEAKPNGKLQVPVGSEREFIAPMPVGKIPGVGDKTAYQLESQGIKTIRKLREMPPRYLEKEFGKSGISLWHKANAQDDSPVVPYREQKSLSTEQTFEVDTMDIEFLNSRLVAMTEYLCHELRRLDKLAGTITVKIKYSDFNTYTQQKSIPSAATDNLILPVVKDLFERLYNRRQLVRLVGIKFSNLVQGKQQINLFTDTAATVNLYQAIDHIKNRFGEKAVTRAICL